MAKLRNILIQMLLIYYGFLIEVKASSIHDTCTNPNGLQAWCVPLNKCPLLLALYNNFDDIDATKFLRSSACGPRNMSSVCCPAATFGTTKPFACKKSDHIKARVFGGENAILRDFPWLVILEHELPNYDHLTDGCAGNIITERFILTAAHCFGAAFSDISGNVTYVRLGEHNREKTEDCDERECKKIQRLRVEKIIMHPKYDPKTVLNDIALVKTDRKIKYSNLIAPICLPDIVMPETQALKNGTPLFLAGWGITQTTLFPAIKQKVELSYVDNDICGRSMVVSPTHLCAKGEIGKSGCGGDSGSAVVRTLNGTWIAEGILSNGDGNCSLGAPEIYSRVSKYIPWILANVN